MAAVVQVPAAPELAVHLAGVPILDIVMEMLLPVDVVHVRIVPQAGGILAENIVQDLLGVVRYDSTCPAIPEPVLEADHMEDISNLVYIAV